jgi:hypothetical protein
MLLYQSNTDNLIIERIGWTIQVRHGRKVIDEMPATMTDYSDTRKAREWVIANVWSGKKC